MKDGPTMRVFAMGMIGLCYFGYMAFSYMCEGTVPDGLLFGTVMLVFGALAGVDLREAVKKFKEE